MITLTGIITPVRVNELIPRECFCILYAQRVNLFGMRALLCSYLRLISLCVIFVLMIDMMDIIVGHSDSVNNDDFVDAVALVDMSYIVCVLDSVIIRLVLGRN